MERAGMWGRLLALVQGEEAADTLEAYQRAGLAVYELLRQVEERRRDWKGQGLTAWSATSASQAELLCAWNAFVLQSLGDEFLQADYRVDPATVGYVPPVTARQVLAFYGQVEGWLSRARQAQSNPGYELDVALPADLPPWSEVEPCPRPHLEGMLAAVRSVRSHAEGALAVFGEASPPPDKQPAVHKLRERFAEANSKAEYAERLWASEPPPDLHERIEAHVKEALERYYHLGQLLAMPSLLERTPRRDVPAGARAARSRPGPGQRGFDPWCLTDPDSRADWKQDREAREAIELLWAQDPDPARTLAIQAEIEAALARGDIGYATKRDGQRLGHYYCCPWAPIYVVKCPVTIGGRKLAALQEFTYDVSAEEIPAGGAFKREVLVGSFRTTTNVDYCNPSAGGHHDAE